MSAPTTQPETILVVDDTPDNLQLLFRALTGEGYGVRCARSGPMALAGSQTMAPDLILLDILMPQMDGFEVCQQLRQTTQTSDVPVIFLSVLDSGIEKAKAFALGASDFISKPFNIDEVLARVKHQLTLNQGRRTIQQQVAHYQQTSQELQQSLSLMMAALNRLTDGIGAFQAVRDAQGQIQDFHQQMANTAFSTLLYQDAGDWAEAKFLDLNTNITDSDLFDLFVQVVETNATIRREMRCHRGDTQHWIEVFATKLQDGVVTSWRDISEAKAQVAASESVKRELYRLATTDGLTQVANRYCFDAYLEAEWYRLIRDQQPLSLLIGDIDKFKRFNDLCGHSVGDRCLQIVAQAIQGVLKRPADLVARYGGEEFAIILPNTPLKGAVQIANEIQTAIRGLRLDNMAVADCRQVRLSLGLACTLPQEGQPLRSFVEAADRALYRAKAQGGDTNCIEIL